MTVVAWLRKVAPGSSCAYPRAPIWIADQPAGPRSCTGCPAPGLVT